MWAARNLPECVVALAPLHGAGATQREILSSTSADVGLDVTYVLLVRDVAEDSGISYRKAKEHVDKVFVSQQRQAMAALDPMAAERERVQRNIQAMAKYKRRA